MILSTVFFIVSKIVLTCGHGRLIDPPARNSMWRFGFENPVNYNDNELFCGGFAVQHYTNKGKCGVCGDDYRQPVPRDHEDGGKYGNGIIVREYKVGQKIRIEADVTANHKGHLETKICPRDDPNTPITQECFDSHPLNLIGQDTNKYSLTQHAEKYTGKFSWDVQLPESMKCSQCVIQWTYRGGNNWGRCENGTEGVSCGPQETFINCADISISELGDSDLMRSDSKVTYHKGDEFSNVVEKNESIPDDTLRPLVVSSQLCVPVGEYKDDEGMKDWCRFNCMKYPPECPAEKCKCLHKCVAIGEFAKKETDADVYCLQNCLKYPSRCPKERCECT